MELARKLKLRRIRRGGDRKESWRRKDSISTVTRLTKNNLRNGPRSKKDSDDNGEIWRNLKVTPNMQSKRGYVRIVKMNKPTQREESSGRVGGSAGRKRGLNEKTRRGGAVN